MGARVGTRRPSGVRRVSDVCFRFNRMASRVEPACRRYAWRPSVDSRSLLTRAMVYGMYCNMYGRLLARPPDVNVVGACRSSSSPRPTAPMSWEFIMTMTMGTWFLLLTSTQRRFFYVSPPCSGAIFAMRIQGSPPQAPLEELVATSMASGDENTASHAWDMCWLHDAAWTEKVVNTRSYQRGGVFNKHDCSSGQHQLDWESPVRQ